MDDQRIGAALRAIRTRKGWRQVDLARRARVSPPVIGRIERGGAATVPLGKLRRVASTLGARLEVFVRWDGADLPRLLDARHAAMQEAVAGLFAATEGWVIEPEVSFSIHGERGIIEILAWHPGRRMLLVVELKTEVVELGLLLGKMDQRRRLASNIARRLGWDPISVSTWVVIADSRTNRRAVAARDGPPAQVPCRRSECEALAARSARADRRPRLPAKSSCRDAWAQCRPDQAGRRPTTAPVGPGSDSFGD